MKSILKTKSGIIISIMFFTLLLLILISPMNAVAKCEVTEEYRDARKKAREVVYGNENDYGKCQDSVVQYEYWKSISKCTEAGDGKEIGGGCAHLVSTGNYVESTDDKHCEIFKFEPNPEQAQRVLDEIMDEQGIDKCIPIAPAK